MFSFLRAAWECSQGALRLESRSTFYDTGRSASSTAFPRGAWERGVDGVSQVFVYNDERSAW